MRTELNKLETGIGSLRTQLKGIGSDGDALNKVSTAVQSLGGNLDSLINRVSEYDGVFDSAIPTTLKQDTLAAAKIKEQQEQAAAAAKQAADEQAAAAAAAAAKQDALNKKWSEFKNTR